MITMNTKELRKQNGLTQDAFAFKLGVAPYTVRRWETGNVKPSKLAKDKIQRVFKIKID